MNRLVEDVFGVPPQISDRWNGSLKLAELGLPSATVSFVEAGLKRARKLRKAPVVGSVGARTPETKPIGLAKNRAATLLTAVLAFGGESLRYPSTEAGFKWELDVNGDFPRQASLEVCFGRSETEVDCRPGAVDEFEFFRDTALWIQAAFGVPREKQIGPQDGWRYTPLANHLIPKGSYMQKRWYVGLEFSGSKQVLAVQKK